MPVSTLDGPVTPSRLDPAALDDVFARLSERVSSKDIPSAALAVGDSLGEIRSAAFAGDGRRVSTDAMFFLASVTKPIFATAFMQLVDAGKVDLDTPIARFIPEFANAPDKADVTARHLLTHTSGVPDVTPETIRRSRPSAAGMTKLAIESALKFKPGTRYEYCTATFYLLARIMEKVSGETYVGYLQKHVLDPLGMRSTFDPRRSGRQLVAVHGAGVNNRLMRFLVLRYLASSALPGGGLFGTLDDLLRFGAATLAPHRQDDGYVPLSPDAIALMQEDQLHGVPGMYDGEEHSVHFGLSWGKPTLMRDLPGSKRVVSHGGATGTRLWIDPDADLVIVFFTNQWGPDRGPEMEAIRGIYEALKPS
jgi:CubicO group peptidase (beta-lactamase class C family)